MPFWGTSTSSERVCQFRHPDVVGDLTVRGHDPIADGEDNNR